MVPPYFARGIPLLPVASVRRSIEFYVDVLDFKMGFNAGQYGGVGRDAIEIHFRRTDDPALPKNSSCRIEVTEIHQLYSQCREKGVVDPRVTSRRRRGGPRSSSFSIRTATGSRSWRCSGLDRSKNGQRRVIGRWSLVIGTKPITNDQKPITRRSFYSPVCWNLYVYPAAAAPASGPAA